MTIQQLEYIVAVETYGSFSAAAQHCFVTQPTLSIQIQKLEEELGVIIFDRTKKPIQVTQVGRDIIDQARRNIDGMARIHELVAEAKNEVKGELRIGVIPTISPYLLPLFITDFLRQYPALNLSIEELTSQRIIDKLKQNLLDVGLLVTPLDDHSLVEIPLFYETFVAYISTNHPLLHRELVGVADLNLEDMFLLSEGHCFRNQVVNICPDVARSQQINHFRFESGSLETLKRIVEQHYGYTLLPELALIDLPADKWRFVRHLTPPRPIREVSLVVHRTILKQSLINKLKQAIVTTVPDELQSRERGRVVNWI